MFIFFLPFPRHTLHSSLRSVFHIAWSEANFSYPQILPCSLEKRMGEFAAVFLTRRHIRSWNPLSHDRPCALEQSAQPSRPLDLDPGAPGAVFSARLAHWLMSVFTEAGINIQYCLQKFSEWTFLAFLSLENFLLQENRKVLRTRV